MTTLFSDGFGATLSATNYDQGAGSSWSVPSGGTAGFVRNNQQPAPAWLRTTTTAHAAVADCNVSVTRIAGTSFDAGPVARFTGSAGSETCYYLDVENDAGTMTIYRRVSGADTQIVQATGQTLANGDVYKLQVSGTGATVTLKMFKNGSQVGSTGSDSSGSRITGAAQTGILCWASGNQDFDDFLVEDVASGGTTTQKTMTDTLTTSDAALDPTYRVRQMSDTVTVTDESVFWRRLKRVMDETLTISDSIVKNVVLAGNTIYTKVMSDTLSLADFAVQWLRRVRDQIDTTILSDGDTYRFSVVTASEAVDVTDGFVSWRRLKRIAQDNLDIIDGFSKTLTGAGIIYAKVMSDVVILVDDAGQRWKLRVSQLTDAVGLSDQALDYLRAVRSLGDVVEFSDGTVKVRRFSRVMDESFEVSDEKISTLYLDQISNTSFSFGASGPPFRFGGM